MRPRLCYPPSTALPQMTNSCYSTITSPISSTTSTSTPTKTAFRASSTLTPPTGPPMDTSSTACLRLYFTTSSPSTTTKRRSVVQFWAPMDHQSRMTTPHPSHQPRSSLPHPRSFQGHLGQPPEDRRDLLKQIHVKWSHKSPIQTQRRPWYHWRRCLPDQDDWLVGQWFPCPQVHQPPQGCPKEVSTRKSAHNLWMARCNRL